MKWGMCLSGGVAYGLANVGIINVLEENDLRPNYIAGSSMGAIVGALWAMGHSGTDLLKLSHSLSLWNVLEFTKKPLKGGLHGGIFLQKLEKHLAPHLGGACIGDCKIPFLCVAGRVKKPIPWHRIAEPAFVKIYHDSVEQHVFSDDTPIISALLASSAIPVVCAPAVIDGEEYIDLVSFGALPARALKKHAAPDVIIGTDTEPSYGAAEKFLPREWKAFIKNSRKEFERDLQMCDLVLAPRLTGSPFAFHHSEKFVAAGSRSAARAMGEIRRLLKS